MEPTVRGRRRESAGQQYLRDPYIIGAKVFVALTITALTVYWIDHVAGWGSVVELLGGIGMADTAIVVGGVAASHVLRAVRLAMCYRTLDTRWREISGVAFLHNSLNFWLPMRLGEFALPILSRHNLQIHYVDSALTLIYIRLMDIHVLLLLVFYFVGGSMLQGLYFWSTLICLSGIPVFFYMVRGWSQRLRLVQRFVNISGSGTFALSTYIVTILVWLSKIGALTYLVVGMSDVSLDHAWLGVILADATSISPVTGIANVGTFEAGFVLPLALFGYDQVQTLPLAVGVHVVLGSVSLTVGLIGWLLLARHGRRTTSATTGLVE